MKNIVALIPARYSSTRFPGKPLALLGGKPVIVHVCERVSQAGVLPVVATDDQRIIDCVEQAGYQAVMTSADHRSGTDRVREALDKIASEAVDVVINVQGDEPFVNPDDIRRLAALFDDRKTEIGTLVRRFDPVLGFDALFDPNLVKVVMDDAGYALYFSRSIIPYVRGKEWQEWLMTTMFHTHVGVYAYRPETLRKIAALPQGHLEKAESLEQLRWLAAGYRIKCLETEGTTIGIDTPEDLAAAEAYLAANC